MMVIDKEKLLNQYLAKQRFRNIQNNFMMALSNKLLYSKGRGINQFSKGLDAIINFSEDLNSSVPYVHKLYYMYIAARKGKVFDTNEEPRDILNTVLEMFQAAKLNDELLNNSIPLDKIYTGSTFRILENYFFGRDMNICSYIFTKSDTELMYIVLKKDDTLVQKNEWTHSLKLIHNLTENENIIGMQKVNYLAREYIAKNMDFDRFFLFRAKVVDYGNSLAVTDQDWKLPKGKAQRFIEKALKIKQEELY